MIGSISDVMARGCHCCLFEGACYCWGAPWAVPLAAFTFASHQVESFKTETQPEENGSSGALRLWGACAVLVEPGLAS